MMNEQSFGHPERYYSQESSDPQGRRGAGGRFQFTVIESLLDSTWKERVERTCRQWNQVVREQMRAETGLRFSSSDARAAVPVRVVDGLPPPLQVIVNSIPEKTFWKMLLLRPSIEDGQKGLSDLLANHDEIFAWLASTKKGSVGGDKQPPAVRDGLDLSLQYVHWVMEAVKEVEIENKIAKIQEDVLGAYFFRRKEIRIYWVASALISRILDVTAEDLSVVVLAHEIAHAYTHLGKDIDGRSWELDAFAKTELAVVEGLAQYYTAVTSKKISERRPGVHEAYKRLLPLQGGPYRVHEKWMADKVSGEDIRFAMIGCRENKLTSCKDFCRFLTEAKVRFRRKA
jgi:hypothetical protein